MKKIFFPAIKKINKAKLSKIKNQKSSYSTKSLVLLEHNNEKLLESNLNVITAAKQLGEGEINGLLLTNNDSGAKNLTESASKISGLNKVIHISGDKLGHFVAERIESAILKVQEEGKYSHILANHASTGKNALPRVAASLDVQAISDVISITSENSFVRPIYAGNALCNLETSDEVKILTVRSTSFEAGSYGDEAAPVDVVELKESGDYPEWISQNLTKSDRPELTSARVVISGGRGLKNGENFKLLYELADQLGGAVGATRAVVDAGFVPNDMQVGQTGKVVAPDLYIACGVSGAIQHLAGMKDSKVIAAINTDAEAPIFQVSDYGLVEDLFKAVPKLTELVKKE